MPDKKVIKDKYNIENDDFEVRTELPSEKEIREKGGFLMKVAELLGAPAWLWKTAGGIVLAVILMTSNVVGHYNTLKPIAISSYDNFSMILQHIKPIPENETVKYVAVVPEIRIPSQHKPYSFEEFPTHSMVFPISGSIVIA